MKHAILFASLGIAAGILLTNVYNSIVDVPAWGHNIPESLQTARQYYSHSNPGNFFRIFSPITQLLGLVSIILFWKQGRAVRLLLIGAFVCYFSAEGLTFLYFYPRNEVMFMSDIANTQALTTAWEQWRSMNWFRSLLILTGFVSAATALHRSYMLAIKKEQYTRHHASNKTVALA